MAYKFLKSEIDKIINGSSGMIGMGSFTFSRGLNIEDIKTLIGENFSTKTEGIIKHDFETFLRLINFLNGNLSTFVLNGFMGSGKSAMINTLPYLINPSVLYFRINCFDSTNLDDVLLSIHTDFVNFHNQRIITLPKVDSNGFTDRINAYLKSCNAPMLFIFDSVDSERSPLHGEILNFIKHISQIDRVKVVLTSRNLANKDLPNDSNSNFAVIKLCGKEEFIEILNSNGIEADEETYENAFVATKGHYLYISLLINVIKLLNINLKSVYNDYSKKKDIIFDFLISKVLTLIPERFFKPLWFLSLIRTGVSENFLIKQKLASTDEIAYLEERMLLCREGTNIYLKDYVKNTVIGTINSQTKKDIHNYLAELYDSQLPKKPSERDLVISRSTMRREAAYHKEEADKVVIEQQQPQPKQNSVSYNYLGYSQSIKQAWNFAESSVGNNQQKRFVKPAPRGMATRIQNNLRSKKFELSNEELNLLNKMNLKVPNAELIKSNAEEEDDKLNSSDYMLNIPDYVNANIRRRRQMQQQPQNPVNNGIENRKVETETLATVMQSASIAEQEFDYEQALKIYSKAYSMTESAGYSEAKPIIMMQTAYCHRKMQNNEEALKCFEFAYNLYKEKNIEKANQALFNMAEIYTETYNHTKAKSMYEQILTGEGNTDKTFIVRVLLNIAEIEINNSDVEKASTYYQKAMKYSLEIQDKKLICETCFKYGLAYDDMGNVENAFKMYVQCVQTSNLYEENSFISSAYSNIAGIYEEQNMQEKAIKYYEMAAKIDEEHKNWDGMYFAYSKLSELYRSKSISFALDYMLKALEGAKSLNDNVYIASAYIQVGDFYYKLTKNKDALNSYLYAKEYLSLQPNPENVKKVDIRINNIKNVIGVSQFNYIVTEFKSKNG
jgi:tetratricopeptide (TPR) repeat protein